MQTTYQVTCKCGHAYAYPAEFLGPDRSRERSGLIKALEGLPCPDCIRAAVEDTRALREDLDGIRSIPVKCPVAEELRHILDDETNECMHYPPPPKLLDVTDSRGEPYPPITREEHAILARIDSWNRHHPIETEVLVTQTGDEQPGDLLAYRTYLTTSPAKMLAGKPVVEVSGLGPIDIDRLIPFFE